MLPKYSLIPYGLGHDDLKVIYFDDSICTSFILGRNSNTGINEKTPNQQYVSRNHVKIELIESKLYATALARYKGMVKINGVPVVNDIKIALSNDDCICMLGSINFFNYKIVSNLCVDSITSIDAAENDEFINCNEKINFTEDHKIIPKILSLSECGICLHLMAYTHTLSPCGHNFCYICIIDWKKQSESCPLCQKEILTLIPSHFIDNVIFEAVKEMPDAFTNLQSRTREAKERKEMDITPSTEASAKKKRKLPVSLYPPVDDQQPAPIRSVSINNNPLQSSLFDHFERIHHSVSSSAGPAPSISVTSMPTNNDTRNRIIPDPVPPIHNISRMINNTNSLEYVSPHRNASRNNARTIQNRNGPSGMNTNGNYNGSSTSTSHAGGVDHTLHRNANGRIGGDLNVSRNRRAAALQSFSNNVVLNGRDRDRDRDGISESVHPSHTRRESSSTHRLERQPPDVHSYETDDGTALSHTTRTGPAPSLPVTVTGYPTLDRAQRRAGNTPSDRITSSTTPITSRNQAVVRYTPTSHPHQVNHDHRGAEHRRPEEEAENGQHPTRTEARHSKRSRTRQATSAVTDTLLTAVHSAPTPPRSAPVLSAPSRTPPIPSLPDGGNPLRGTFGTLTVYVTSCFNKPNRYCTQCKLPMTIYGNGLKLLSYDPDETYVNGHIHVRDYNRGEDDDFVLNITAPHMPIGTSATRRGDRSPPSSSLSNGSRRVKEWLHLGCVQHYNLCRIADDLLAISFDNIRGKGKLLPTETEALRLQCTL